MVHGQKRLDDPRPVNHGQDAHLNCLRVKVEKQPYNSAYRTWHVLCFSKKFPSAYFFLSPLFISCTLVSRPPQVFYSFPFIPPTGLTSWPLTIPWQLINSEWNTVVNCFLHPREFPKHIKRSNQEKDEKKKIKFQNRNNHFVARPMDENILALFISNFLIVSTNKVGFYRQSFIVFVIRFLWVRVQKFPFLATT